MKFNEAGVPQLEFGDQSTGREIINHLLREAYANRTCEHCTWKGHEYKSESEICFRFDIIFGCENVDTNTHFCSAWKARGE